MSSNIQIADIESELKQLWEINREKKVTKACLFNLIIFAPDLRRANYLKLVVQDIIEKFPCRILFIHVEDDSNGNFLHVNVSTVTSDMGGTPVACDQITIDATKSFLERVPYIVIPHLLPDLPIYLLWGQNPVDEKVVLPPLLKYATRLIFDSECLETLSSFSEGILEKLKKFDFDVMDMNWALSGVWREIFVQIFDCPEKIQQLNDSQSIKIIFNNYKTDLLEHAEIRAMYLQAWLASRLDWKFQSIHVKDRDWVIIYTKNGRPITVTLTPHTQKDLSPGSIINIEITSYQNDVCHIARNQKLSQVLVNISNAEKCELPFTLPLPDVHRGFAFLKEIFYHKMSNQYRSMLQTFSQITCKNSTS